MSLRLPGALTIVALILLVVAPALEAQHTNIPKIGVLLLEDLELVQPLFHERTERTSTALSLEWLENNREDCSSPLILAAKRAADLAQKHRLPTITSAGLSSQAFPDFGGLMSYGANPAKHCCARRFTWTGRRLCSRGIS